MLQLACIHPDAPGVLTFVFAIGEIELMAAEAVRQALGERNVYVEGRTVIATGKGRGKASATRDVFAFVIDADADKGRDSHDRVAVRQHRNYPGL